MCPIAPCHSSPASSSLTTWPKTWDERTKRMYSLNLRSSAWASRETVHLSAMVGTQKNARHWQGQAGTRNPSVETGWRETRVMAVMSGGLIRLAVGPAQIGPIDIWAQVFTADGAIGCTLNSRAALSRDRAGAGNPLAYCRRRHTDGARKCRLASSNRARDENRFLFHLPIIRRRLTLCNRNCLIRYPHGKLGDA